MYTVREVILIDAKRAERLNELAGSRPEFCAPNGQASKGAVFRRALDLLFAQVVQDDGRDSTEIDSTTDPSPAH